MHSITAKHDSKITITSNNNDTTAPTENIIRSKGLNILNISVPFLALAGTKYPFTMYHTPPINYSYYY